MFHLSPVGSYRTSNYNLIRKSQVRHKLTLLYSTSNRTGSKVRKDMFNNIHALIMVSCYNRCLLWRRGKKAKRKKELGED